MNRWLFTWAVTDRKEQTTYLMEVYQGDHWEDGVAEKLRVHADDRSYPNWCVMSVVPMGLPGQRWSDELSSLLKD